MSGDKLNEIRALLEHGGDWHKRLEVMINREQSKHQQADVNAIGNHIGKLEASIEALLGMVEQAELDKALEEMSVNNAIAQLQAQLQQAQGERDRALAKYLIQFGLAINDSEIQHGPLEIVLLCAGLIADYSRPDGEHTNINTLMQEALEEAPFTDDAKEQDKRVIAAFTVKD